MDKNLQKRDKLSEKCDGFGGKMDLDKIYTWT